MMDKRKWQAPRTLALGDLGKSLGDCLSGSTANQVDSDCLEGSSPRFYYESCSTGSIASGQCFGGSAAT